MAEWVAKQPVRQEKTNKGKKHIKWVVFKNHNIWSVDPPRALHFSPTWLVAQQWLRATFSTAISEHFQKNKNYLKLSDKEL